jgi:hypothetical protein
VKRRLLRWHDVPCKEWDKARNEHGYGVKRVNYKLERVHRLAWAQKNGPIPDGVKILHKCDNPPCYEVRHLRAGTQADNISDMVRKGRARGGTRGERHGNAKLTPVSVVEIRELVASKSTTQRALAAKYGVTPGAINHVVKGRLWK